MKKFEIIAIVVLVVIAAICIPIFISQLINSDTDVPVFSLSNSTNDSTKNSTVNNIDENNSNSSMNEPTNNTSNNTSVFFDITETTDNTIVEDIPKKPTSFDITVETDNSNSNSTSSDDEFTIIVDEGNSSNTHNNIIDISSTSTGNNNNDSSVTISYLNQQAATFPYYIKVNVAANTITVYSKDESGNYTVPHKAFVCSTGTATPHSRCLCYTSKI